MNFYTCDNWIVMEASDKSHYRLLVGTYGGYLGSDSWRLNSGITKFEDDGDYWNVYGSSGSVYRCHKETYAVTRCSAGTYNQLIERGWKKLPEETDWLNFDWIIDKEG